MGRQTELAILRRAFAKQILAVFGAQDRQVEKAFATVPREDFLPQGPWQVVRWGRGYVPTPSRDPVYLYDDVVVAILPERNHRRRSRCAGVCGAGRNNGQPSLHAWLMSAAAPRAGEHVVHIGTGNGYYTTILARLVGRRGRVTAVEYDPELAARSASNLARLSHVTIVNGDGNVVDFAPADVIYVNAAATQPGAHWLDRLREGGRLILPLTEAGSPQGDIHRGAVFRIERRGTEYMARRIFHTWRSFRVSADATSRAPRRWKQLLRAVAPKT